MKLTEKELENFPIGTKLIINDMAVYIKTYDNEWIRQGTEIRFNNNYFIVDELYDYTVLIPTYTEYIPPKPILDDKEKEYLSELIKPWKNELRYISKVAYSEEKEFISIATGISWFVSLPLFKTNTMYKGMEQDKEYTLEELRAINS